MEKPKVMIIGGTSEGRMLASSLLVFSEVHMTVATEYGGHLVEDHNQSWVIHVGRRDEKQMTDLINQIRPIFLLDATHPYAKEVTKIARQACLKLDIPYYRIKRGRQPQKDVHYVPDTKAAVEYLSQTIGNILLTCGSKEMAQFTTIDQFDERIYARILPQEDVLRSCIEMGFQPSHLALMQGPFSLDFNKAHLQMVEAKYLVTKDSGTVGGFMQKVQAAKELGIQVVVIDRDEEEGYSVEEFMDAMMSAYGWAMLKEVTLMKTPEINEVVLMKSSDRQPEFFPLFHNLKNKKVVIFGGGQIAKRRIKGLKAFGCLLTVVAPECDPEILELERQQELMIHHRCYLPSDCANADYVLACTNNHKVNEEIYQECKDNNVIVNVAHRKELSDFYFPGLVVQGDLVVGITAGGRNHRLAKEVTSKIEKVLYEMNHRDDEKDWDSMNGRGK